MKNLPLLIVTLLTILLESCQDRVNDNFKVFNLKCEYLSEAVVVKSAPRFSWQLSSPEKGQRQSSWQVIVSDNIDNLDLEIGDVWDSGRVNNDSCFSVKWQGDRLKSLTKYYWKVRAWDINGDISNWSETSSFITGALSRADWSANWIGDRAERPLDYPLVYKHIGYLSSYSSDLTEEKWVQIDLGEIKSFDKIKLYPSYNDNRDIKDYYFPQEYRVEVSRDKKSWSPVVLKRLEDRVLGAPVEHLFDKIESRYIRFTATKLKSYRHRNYDPERPKDGSNMFAFSIAEIEIILGSRVESKGCSVTYKDALIKLDRDNGYDPDMVTDGVLGTPPPPEKRATPPSPLLRKSINFRDKPIRALAYVSALGLYEISFNGKVPDGRVLAPEWTDYNKRVQYQVFDVTELLSSGDNVIGAQLADGWYAGMLGPIRWSRYFPKRGVYGLDRRLFFQMELEFSNGDRERVISDDSWKIYSDGPIRFADNFVGENYDANMEIEGWLDSSFDDSSWSSVVSDKLPNINLVPQINQPIKVVETVAAKSVTKSKGGDYIFDIGQNIAGWCSIDIVGNQGDLVVLQHGEMIDEDGELYTENLGMAVQIDSVRLGDSGELKYEPKFTYHGFRYVEVKGLRGAPSCDMLEAKVVASDQPRTGHFECSNQMLNQLYKNINRSHVSNMHGVPTDCPQRDERCGWMGDAYIFGQTSIFNRDMGAFYNKWVVDIMDAQSKRGTFPDIAPHPFAYEKHFTGVPGWADAAIEIPYTLYLNYDDREVISDNFESFVRYINNIHKSNPDLIWRHGLGNNYGDWLNGNTLNAEGFPKEGAQIPSEVFSTIMFYNSTNRLSDIARVVGRDSEATYYAKLASDIKLAFLKTFVSDSGVIEGDAQACYAMALYYGLYTEDNEANFERRMLDKFAPYKGRMNTGFHSTLPLMKELVKRGYIDKFYQLLETKEFPSWGYSIEQGATSIWERWDGYIKGRGLQGAGMNSFNHYAFGAVGEMMYENILGIQPLKEYPGFKHFVLKPLPGGSLTWAKGSYSSIGGEISVEWSRDEDRFIYKVQIPTNCKAKIYMPSLSIESVMLDGVDLSLDILDSNLEYRDGYTIFTLPSGVYSIESTI